MSPGGRRATRSDAATTGHHNSKRPGSSAKHEPGTQPIGGYQMTVPEELPEYPLAVEADAPAEEQPIPVYTECANWRCGNEVRDGGDYCAFCTDAGKGTPAFGPIR